MQKVKKIRSKKHLKFIASLPCLITGRDDVQAAHIRIGNNAGMALKSGDDCTIPLSCEEHAKQGRMGEIAYWEQHGGIKKATELAHKLYALTGDRESAREAIARWKM